MCLSEPDLKLVMRETETRARQFKADCEAENKAFAGIASAIGRLLGKLRAANAPVILGEMSYRRANK